MAGSTEKIIIQVQVRGQKDLNDLSKGTDKAKKGVGGLTMGLSKMVAGLYLSQKAFQFVTGTISKAIKTYAEFEFTMAKVKAVTGATGMEFEKLSKSAQELGRTTFFTASQVAKLQENYGKLGFTTEEILKAQEATIDLATATGSDLARSAIVAGAAIRGFGLDAGEAGRVVDVMAVAFTSSALDIEKWQTSMTKVAPIAKSAGFSIEDTAAMLGLLTDSGIEASIAGTSLRNILLKMQDPTSKLTRAFGGTIHGLDDLVPAMKKFISEGGKMADIMEVVDLRQAAAFEQLLTSSDSITILRDAMLSSNGAAAEMAAIIGDTLEGSFLRMKSAVEGLFIALSESLLGKALQHTIDAFAFLINQVTRFTEINISEKLEQERIQMKMNVLQVKRLAEGTEDRVKALRELQLRYPDYFGNLSAETASNKDLEKAMKDANQQYLNRIMLQTKEEDIKDVMIKSNQKRKELEEQRKKLETYIIAITEKYGKDIDFGSKSAEEMALTLISRGVPQTVRTQLERGIIYTNELKNELKGTVKELEAIQEEADKTAELFGLNRGDEEPSTTPADCPKGFKFKNGKCIKIKIKSQDPEKTLEVRLKEAQKIVDDLRAEGLVSEKDYNQKVLEEKIKATNKVISETTKGQDTNIKAVAKKSALLLELDKEKYKKQLALAKKFKEDELVLLKSDDISESERNQRKLQIEQEFLNLKLEANKKYYKDVDDVNREILLNNLELQALYSNQLRKEVGDVNELGQSISNLAGENEKLNFIKVIGTKVTQAAALAESILNLQKEIGEISSKRLAMAELQANMQSQAGIGITIQSGIASLFKAGANAAEGTTAQSKLIFPYNLFAIAGTIAAIVGVIGSVKSLFGGASGGKLDSLGSGGLDSGGDSSMMLKTYGGKHTTFSRGGIVSGNSHLNGGVSFAVGGSIAELEGNEGVLNKTSMSNPFIRAQASRLNQMGGGVAFADGGLLNQPSFAQAQFNVEDRNSMMSKQSKVVVIESDITDTQNTVSLIQSEASF